MKLGKLDEVLTADYRCRRQMMIKRFQVTLESFAWGEKEKVCVLKWRHQCHIGTLILFDV